jgi:tRNA pseudouridine38-40 synthase
VRHIRLILQYDGTDYSGWQVQNIRTQSTDSKAHKRIITIQSALQDAIERVTGKREKITGASRTDAGVHALGQVASFRTDTSLDPETLKKALNANLPFDIRITGVDEVDEDFHPRYSAKRKVYSYLISHSQPHSVFLRRYTWQVNYDLSSAIDVMREAATYIEGEYDFSCFRASGCASKNPIKVIHKINIDISPCIEFLTFRLNARLFKITIEANAFLRHMVRNIAGTLVDIGRGKLNPSYMKELLLLRDRKYAGKTAPACGLFLERIIY